MENETSSGECFKVFASDLLLPNQVRAILIVAILEESNFSRVETFSYPPNSSSADDDKFQRSAIHIPWGAYRGRPVRQRRLTSAQLIEIERLKAQKRFREMGLGLCHDDAGRLAYLRLQLEPCENPLEDFRTQLLSFGTPDFRDVTTSNCIALTNLAESLAKLKPPYYEVSEDDWTSSS